MQGDADAIGIVIPAYADSVREALRTLFDTLLLRRLPVDQRGTAELVLAEALNNIVEHAYARQPGQIHVMLQLAQRELTCRIEDSGNPMPDNELPGGVLCPTLTP